MEILGPAIMGVGVATVSIAIFAFAKKKDKRTSRQKHLDDISKIRGDK
jgi:hypothetical protein